jgi:hypothetical protein
MSDNHFSINLSTDAHLTREYDVSGALVGFESRGLRVSLVVELPEGMVKVCLGELQELLESWRDRAARTEP